MEQEIYSATADFERRYVKPRSGRTLIAGARVYPGREDRRLKYEAVEGWDIMDGAGVDRVIDLERELPADTGLFVHVDCTSVLEHTRRPWAVAQNLEKVLCAGGTLFLTVPFIWRVHAYPDDYWRFTISGVRELFTHIDWSALHYASIDLTDDIKVRGVKVQDYPYFARTEVCGFGVRI